MTYTPGELLEGRDPQNGTWRPCWVKEDAPYLKGQTGGAYIQWDDDVQAPADDLAWKPSAGGWLPDNCLRPRPA